MRFGLTAALVAVNVLLAVLIGALWITPEGKLRGTHWAPPAAVRPDLGAVPVVTATQDDIDTARFVTILDRPLFSTTRRPAPVLAKSGDAGRPDALEGLHLYGYFSGSEGSGIIARVDGKTRRVKVSETIGDWSLKAIQGQQVIFSRGAETRFVALAQARQGSVAAAAPGVLAPGYGGDPAFRRIPRAIRRLPQLSGPATAPPPPAQAAPQPSPAAAAPPAAPASAPPAARKAASASTSSSPFVIGGSR